MTDTPERTTEDKWYDLLTKEFDQLVRSYDLRHNIVLASSLFWDLRHAESTLDRIRKAQRGHRDG